MVCHQAGKAPEGFGDPSPGIMDKGLCNSNTRRVRPPLSYSCTIRLIAFGIRCGLYTWSLRSSANRNLSDLKVYRAYSLASAFALRITPLCFVLLIADPQTHPLLYPSLVYT
jgi:hypothetical protein